MIERESRSPPHVYDELLQLLLLQELLQHILSLSFASCYMLIPLRNEARQQEKMRDAVRVEEGKNYIRRRHQKCSSVVSHSASVHRNSSPFVNLPSSLLDSTRQPLLLLLPFLSFFQSFIALRVSLLASSFTFRPITAAAQTHVLAQ